MNLQLQSQTVVIAGAARGIGAAIAKEFAREQAHLALIDRESVVRDVARQLAADFGVRACASVCDVTRYETVKAAAAQIQSDLGRLDHLVFAVGVGSGKYGFPFWELEPCDWPRVLEINVIGAVNVVHAFSPCFIKAKSGSILLIASVAGQMGSQTDPPYSASKAAVINFMQCAAKDLAEYNVRVNALCPGMVKTELNKSVWEAWNRRQPDDMKQSYEQWAGQKIQRMVPLRRWQEPEEMAAMSVYLASRHGRNITGQCLNVDGGCVMHW
jgi:NAD(P)-dependent dehydrogenase (short-subunit alcohol dehydrogenase family)